MIYFKRIYLLSFFILYIISKNYAQDPNFNWVVNFGGNDENDYIRSTAIDQNENVYSIGTFQNTVDFNSNPNETFNLTSPGYDMYDAYVAKYDSSGNFIWAFQLGSTYHDLGKKIIYDPAGFIYVTGNFHQTVDFDPGEGEYWLTTDSYPENTFIAKYDTSGNFVWAMKIGGECGISNSLALDDDGNLYNSGIFYGTVDFNPGDGIYEMTATSIFDQEYILKLSPDKEFIWAKQFGGSYYVNYIEQMNSVTVDGLNNVIVSGVFEETVDFDPGPGFYNMTSNGCIDIFLLKLDENGNFLWAKQFGGIDYDYVYSLFHDTNNNILLSGSFRSVVDFDPGENEYILTASSSDPYILKLNENGEFLWVAPFQGSDSYYFAENFNTSMDRHGDIYTTGFFESTFDFDPGLNEYFLTTDDGLQSVFIVKLNSEGSFIWALKLGGPGFALGFDVVVGTTGNIYTSGMFFNDVIDFDPGPEVYNVLPPLFGWECFVHMMKQPNFNIGVNDILANEMNIFPNPNNGEFIVDSQNKSPIIITNSQGKIVRIIQPEGKKTSVNLSDQPAGIYLISTYSEHTFISKKFIKR
jgi:hypothetical protein